MSERIPYMPGFNQVLLVREGRWIYSCQRCGQDVENPDQHHCAMHRCGTCGQIVREAHG